eukprot:111396-Amphidinium_carterae.2
MYRLVDLVQASSETSSSLVFGVLKAPWGSQTVLTRCYDNTADLLDLSTQPLACHRSQTRANQTIYVILN